ncbi:MAG: sulfurtransferase complex subunit TusB [Pseudomonadales bacterium]|nr:sulfurtransferase complex subunit TusB [Pseudomonadales bacterium]
MNILFIVNHMAGLDSCLALAGATDTVLLIEDGVYAAVTPRAWSGRLIALEPDVRARGLAARLAPGVTLVDDAGFVELTVAHSPVVSWR